MWSGEWRGLFVCGSDGREAFGTSGCGSYTNFSSRDPLQLKFDCKGLLLQVPAMGMLLLLVMFYIQCFVLFSFVLKSAWLTSCILPLILENKRVTLSRSAGFFVLAP